MEPLDGIVKTWVFSAEGIELKIHLKKETDFKYGGVRLFLDFEIAVTDNELRIVTAQNGGTRHNYIYYKNDSFYSICYNPHKGLRWGDWKVETSWTFYKDLEGFKVKYVQQATFLDDIGKHFYSSVEKYKLVRLLFEEGKEDILPIENGK